MNLGKWFALALIPMMSPHPAHAGLITSQSSMPVPNAVATFSDWLGFNIVSPSAPRQVNASTGGSVLVTSNSTSTFIGNPDFFGLASNGSWNSSIGSYVGGNPPSYELVFHFSGNVSGVGGFFNYAPGSVPAPIITALNSQGQTLESYNIDDLAPISTPGATNAGAFRGILRNQADIAAFAMSGSSIVMDDLRFTRVSVPEPSSLQLCVCGSFLLILLRRRIP